MTIYGDHQCISLRGYTVPYNGYLQDVKIACIGKCKQFIIRIQLAAFISTLTYIAIAFGRKHYSLHFDTASHEYGECIYKFMLHLTIKNYLATAGDIKPSCAS